MFDTDGVVTDLAAVHAAAWEQPFDEVLASRAGDPRVDARPFDVDDDYRPLRRWPLARGPVRTFLAARGVDLPAGGSDDPPERPEGTPPP